MASSSSSKDHLSIEALVSSHAPPFFFPQYDDGVDKARVILPYPYGLARRHNGVSKRLSHSKAKSITAGFAALASLVAIVMLIYMCKAVKRKVAGSAANQRKLSDDGEDSDPDALIICEDTDDDDDVIFVSTTPPTRPEEEQAGPSAKLAKLEAGATQVVTAKSTVPYPRKPHKRPATRHQRGSPSGQDDQSASASGRQETQPVPTDTGAAAAAPPCDDSPGPLRSPEEVIATQGLLLLQGDLTAAPEDLQGSSQQQQQAPAQQLIPSLEFRNVLTQVSPVIWRSQVVQVTAGAGSSAAGVEVQSPPSTLPPGVQGAQQHTGESPAISPFGQVSGDSLLEGREESTHLQHLQTSAASSASAVPPHAEAGPSTSSDVAESEQPSTSGTHHSQRGQTPLEHPFSRLPSQTAFGYKRRFDPQQALNDVVPIHRIVPACRQMAKLLALDSLDKYQMNMVSYLAESLLSHLTRFQSTDVTDSPGHQAVGILGYRFLMFDLLVSALHVLREPIRGPWWDQAVAAVPHNYAYAYEDPRKYPVRAFNQDLARDLSNALATLKTGHRPEKQKLVEIKRMLFCSRFSPKPFKGPGWNSWRAADREFGGNDDEDED